MLCLTNFFNHVVLQHRIFQGNWYSLQITKNMATPTVGFILMLDKSVSMKEAIGQVKIDANAFIGEALPKDQFGIVQFATSAGWIYPTGTPPVIKTVSADKHEIAEANRMIEKMVADGSWTNISSAILLGKDMINQATTDVKAFVLLTDGDHNQGRPYPEDVLAGDQPCVSPPIYIAGLGRWLTRRHIDKMLEVNANSAYFHGDYAEEVAGIFNNIRALAPNAALLANKFKKYEGSNYQVVPAYVNGDSGKTQFSVVWGDKKYKYTSGYPTGNNINVVLIDPQGKHLKTEPDVVGDGYCVFNLDDARSGQWQVLVQYSLAEQSHGTVGMFQLDTAVSMEMEMPSTLRAGEPLNFKVNLKDGDNPIENMVVNTELIHPAISVENALKKHATQLKSVIPADNLIEKFQSEELAKLDTLRKQLLPREDILANRAIFSTLSYSAQNGIYEKTFDNTHEAGSYTLKVEVKGINPLTGKPVSLVKSQSVSVS